MIESSTIEAAASDIIFYLSLSPTTIVIIKTIVNTVAHVIIIVG
jgi:hypothetical protein